MFSDYLYEKCSAEYYNRIILIDEDDIAIKTNYADFFAMHGFQIINYIDDLDLRINHNEAIVDCDGKYLIISKKGKYVPYDVIKQYKNYTVSLENLFSKLNVSVLKEHHSLNLDLLTTAYKGMFKDCRSPFLTQQFIDNAVYGRDNLILYLNRKSSELHNKVIMASNYKDWFEIANLKATIDTMAIKYDVEIITDDIHEWFVRYLFSDYGKISSEINRNSPVLVSRVMEYVHDNSDKFCIIIMDGMSEFDWEIISKSFIGIEYEKSDVFAMIPTTTSISRQCIISNKYPKQLMEPWKQSKEKVEFFDCAKNIGFTQEQIEYKRGYDADFSSFIKCATIIINDIDDMVHAQKQQRKGMYNDLICFNKEGKLINLVRRLLKKGFDVYITSDHGNTPCVGMGRLMKTGVETETKSRRMIVLKEFADKQELINKYNLIEFPKYYLIKSFDYLICNAGSSFDIKNEKVMTHGGVSVDEVIVPFIKIKAGLNNG